MNNNLRLLYKNTLSKYRKFKSRYDKNLKTGRFYEISSRKQHQIVARLKKLHHRLMQLQWQLKLAAATGVLALSLQVSPVQSQQLGPFVQNDLNNPFFRTVNYDGNKKITFADLDNDGDLDAAIGVDTGEIIYYENRGTATSGRFVIRTGYDSPFNSITSPYSQAAPEFVDFDGDGDQDMILGDFNGYYSNPGVYYYENTDFEDDGIIGNGPNFVEITSPGSPIDNISASKYDVKPAIVDIDGDGDLDVFLGQDGGFPTYESLLFFENNSGFSSQPLPSGLAEFEFDTSNGNIAPTFHDYDGDGDQDLFIGDISGAIRYFKNTDLDPSKPSDTTIGDDIAFLSQAKMYLGLPHSLVLPAHLMT
ncbi:MAG: VCBS repeat-containing protein [Fulvivirga sp.]